MASILTPEQLEAARSQDVPALRVLDFGMGRDSRRMNRE